MVPRKLNSPNKPRIYTPPLPFPQRFRKAKLDAQFAKFLDIFKKLEINILFADALAQMPNYVKFMKEIMSNRKKLDAYGTVSLSENCSEIRQRKLSNKLKDPDSFTIPCIIGEHTFSKALCDLRASINLTPLSVFKRLNLGKLTPTSLSLQMADRSMTSPKGIIENVIIKIDKFIFLVDFVVLDKEEDAKIPLILGRPFPTTSRPLIDVESGELTLRVGDDKVCLSIYKNEKLLEKENDVCMKVEAMPLQGVQKRSLKISPRKA